MQLKIHFKALETLVTTKIWTWHLQTNDQIPKIKTKHWACTEIDWEWFIRAFFQKIKYFNFTSNLIMSTLDIWSHLERPSFVKPLKPIPDALQTASPEIIFYCHFFFFLKNTVLLKNDKINTFKTVYNKIKLYWMNVYWWIIEQLILFKD